MTRRVGMVAVAGVAAVLLAPAAPAVAAPCPSERSEVLDLEPVGPITADDVIEFFVVNRKRNAKVVTGLVPSIDGVAKDRIGPPVRRGSYLVVPDGIAVGPHSVSIQWTQAASGGTPACDGSDSSPIQVYKSGTEIGDPGGPLLKGTWRVRARPVDYRAKADTRTFTFKPTCVDGACDTRLTSSLGLKATLIWTGQRYEYQRQGARPERGLGCRVGSRVIPNAFFLYNELSIRVTKRGTTGQASAFTGTQRRTFEPTAGAAARGCASPIIQTTRLHGTRTK